MKAFTILLLIVCTLFCAKESTAQNPARLLEEAEIAYSIGANTSIFFIDALRLYSYWSTALAKSTDLLRCKTYHSLCTEARVNLTLTYASAYILSNWYPEIVDIYIQRRLKTLVDLETSSSVKEDAKYYGEMAAKSVLRDQANDGTSAFLNYNYVGGQGRWQPTPENILFFGIGDLLPLGPQWEEAESYSFGRGSGRKSLSDFVPVAPPSLSSATFANDYYQLYYFGNVSSVNRTYDQSQLAAYAQAVNETLIATYGRLFLREGIARGKGAFDLSQGLALIYQTAFDEFISNTYIKQIYDFWRPVTAIRSGVTVNPSLPVDPYYLPFNIQPGNQEYVSGHAQITTGVAEMAKIILGSNNFVQAITLAPLPRDGPVLALPPFFQTVNPRTWTSWDQFADEMALARVYGGLHYLTSCTVGQEIGREVAENAFEVLCRNRRCFRD